ncbi:hypothetical protein EYC84_005585 [Monilinia fructicola]|uniref:Uncharacterized protein n=1 Tax=Monilinia fructicola TaxID=38448 RepID=A0A5M9K5G3_MONFR|nr:hypothetical protein EYC84_005585 [Monilinia fructicola]
MPAADSNQTTTAYYSIVLSFDLRIVISLVALGGKLALYWIDSCENTNKGTAFSRETSQTLDGWMDGWMDGQVTNGEFEAGV